MGRVLVGVAVGALSFVMVAHHVADVQSRGPSISGTVQSASPKLCTAQTRFVGMTFGDAQKLIKRCGDDLTNVYRVPDRAPAGTVISQDPVNPGGRLVVSTGPLRRPWAVLAGAKNPPVRSECTAPLRLDADGNAGPLTCGNDHVNVEAWDYFALDHFPVMSLQRGSSECRVVGAITKDYVSVPINDSAFQLANVYNGWKIPEGLAAHVLVSTPYNDPC